MPQVPPPKRHPYDQWSPDARALDLVGDKWTLLIIRDLATGPRRFVDLQRVLPGISTEQLRSRLNRLVADDILTRTRYREVPPRVDYELTPRAHDLMPVLADLAQWGYRWAWSAPRAGERVEVGAILRLAPGLVDTWRRSGVVQCTVTDGQRDGGALMMSIRIGERGSEISEKATAGPEAAIIGDTHAWVDAFSPVGSLDGLRISGDRELAEHLLERLGSPHVAEHGGNGARAGGATHALV